MIGACASGSTGLSADSSCATGAVCCSAADGGMGIDSAGDEGSSSIVRLVAQRVTMEELVRAGQWSKEAVL
jgi:hypothetical protein